MTEPETRYQKYLARKRQKQRKEDNPDQSGKAGSMASQVALAANAPIHECLGSSANLFEQGIGNLVFSRSLPGGRMALAMFLLECIFVWGSRIPSSPSWAGTSMTRACEVGGREKACSRSIPPVCGSW